MIVERRGYFAATGLSTFINVMSSRPGSPPAVRRDRNKRLPWDSTEK